MGCPAVATTVVDVDVGVVHQGQAEVCVNLLSKMDEAPAPVGVQRRLNIAALADLREHLLQQRRAPGLFARTGAVVIVKLLHALRLDLHDLVGVGIVERSVVQLFKHKITSFRVLPVLYRVNAPL